MGFNLQGRMRLFCLQLACSLLPFMACAATAFDRLQVPAQVTERAAQSLLLDIARAGERLVAVGEQVAANDVDCYQEYIPGQVFVRRNIILKTGNKILEWYI